MQLHYSLRFKKKLPTVSRLSGFIEKFKRNFKMTLYFLITRYKMSPASPVIFYSWLLKSISVVKLAGDS